MDRFNERDFEAYEQEVPAGDAGIIDLTSRTPRDQRKGTRRPGAVDSVVLHQMACCFRPRDPLQRFLTITAHFAITADGRILQLHPASALLWASNGFNGRSVAVEFAGNFPDTAGRWWEGARFGRNQVTRAQIDAGRRLIRHLRSTLGIRYVFAHRQSSGSRDNDPGPDIWFNVGQWAVQNAGLSDGGPGYRIGTGNPIPAAWRTWARPIAPELGAAFEGEVEETELAHDAVSSAELARPGCGCGCGKTAGGA
jgi:N-acetylmuramoyl-L-alanine amidase-like protein